MKLTRTFLLATLFCAAPTSLLLTGCGGGTSITTGIIRGSYTGTYNVTSGPDVNETGPVSIVIDGDGDITGSVTDAQGNTATLAGTANLSNGNFNITGLFGQTGNNGQASGEIRVDGAVVRGSGTFALSNGNSGTITFSKNLN